MRIERRLEFRFVEVSFLDFGRVFEGGIDA